MKKFDFLVLMLIAVTFSAVACFAYATRRDNVQSAFSQSPSVVENNSVQPVSGNPVLALDKRPLFDADNFTFANFKGFVDRQPITGFYNFQSANNYSRRPDQRVKYRRILYDKPRFNYKNLMANNLKPRSSPTRR